MKKQTKHQLNNRVPIPIWDATQKVREKLEWTGDDIAEVAFAYLFGSKDELIVAKRNKIQKACKELGLSFNNALGQPQELRMAA